MFVPMFLAIVLQLIASLGTFAALVAQNLYTNSAAGWYIRLDWTAVYSYAVTIFSTLISFSLTVGALARNASGSKRTCSGWFNPFVIFILSFILAVLWVVIAGFAYRNPLPMRYPCDIFRHLRGSLEMLGITSGKSLVEEGGLLVGICQSSKAFLVLTGIGLGLWILILILSCVSVGTGLEPPSKKSTASTHSSRRSIRSIITSITSIHSKKSRGADPISCEEHHTCTDRAPIPDKHFTARHGDQQHRTNVSAPQQLNAYSTNNWAPSCNHPGCGGHTSEQLHAQNQNRSTASRCPQRCAQQQQGRQNARPPPRAYTHHRNRYSGTRDIARTPSLPSPTHNHVNRPHRVNVLANPDDAFRPEGYSQDILPRDGLPADFVGNQNAVSTQEHDTGHGKHDNVHVHNEQQDHQHGSPHNENAFTEEDYEDDYSRHHSSPHSQQSRRQRLRQLFNREDGQ